MTIGRPKLPFDQDIADRICEAIASGSGLVPFLNANPDMPTYSTVMRWARDVPSFLQEYTRARDDSADLDADRVAEVAQAVRDGLLDPNAARVAIDAYKWSAGKRKPKKYGDKVEIATTGTMAVSHTLDVSNLSIEELDVLQKALGGA
jgi:hypothetical protein